MKKLIQVTQEDIKLGKAADLKSCPIARALRRTFKHKKIEASGTIIVGGWENNKMMKSTPEIITFMKRFDNGLDVDPFEFYFEPNTSLKL